MSRFTIILALSLLIGCQSREKAVITKVPVENGNEVSGLPKARPAVTPEDANAPPKVARGEKKELPAAAVLFPNSEAARARWASKRSSFLAQHQRAIEQHEIRHEHDTGKALPKVQVGEMNVTPPRIDPR